MKMIVLVALLAAAGCSKKATSECEPSITKGMDNFAATVKTRAVNPQMQESMMNVVGKLKTTLTQRCIEDKWAPEVTTCFTTVANMKDMQACQSKLTTEQHTKVSTAIREIMLSSRGPRPGPGMSGHPPMLQGSSAPGAAEAGSAAAPAVGSAAAPAGSAAPAPTPAAPAPAAPAAK